MLDLYTLLFSPPNRSRLPLPEPAMGFFLSKGSFTFLLSPSAAHKGLSNGLGSLFNTVALYIIKCFEETNITACILEKGKVCLSI